MKKVEDYDPPVDEIPATHNAVFGTILVMLFCTPGVWYALYKLRQHPEEDEEDSDNGSWFEDKDAADNLAMFKAQEGLTFAIAQLQDEPAISPRGSNPSAVAMAPQIEEGFSDLGDNQIEDNVPPTEEVVCVCGTILADGVMVCPDCGTERPQKEEAIVKADDGDSGMRDPRGEVEPQKT